MMYLRLHDHALVDDLYVHYRRSGFTAEPVGGGMVEIRRPDAANDKQEHRDISMHLRIWQLVHPEARAEVL